MKKKPEIDVAQPDDLEPQVQFVGDLTRAYGLNHMKVESIALITNLRATGSNPAPSDRRETLRLEMKTNGVAHPDDVLALDSTAMAYVKVYLPPGARKGDRCDAIVEAPPRSETTSLREGWLMYTRLRPVEVLGSRLRQGQVLGSAGGPVIVDAVFRGEEDKINAVRGRVLGGAKSLVDRPIGLVVIGENHSLMTTTHVAAAVNRRFYANLNAKRVGAAEPKDDDYIELKVDPAYKYNLGRYMRVLRNVAMHETPQQRIERLARLELLLLEPVSSSRAALRLEAIGAEGIPVLKKGMQSPDPEVRFYSSEALAYLDEPDAAPVLAEYVRQSRAFRWHALAALSVMKHAAGMQALHELLHSPGAEARCGALRAIRTRTETDPVARGEVFGQAEAPTLRLVTIPSPAEPLVHFLRYREPEVAIFGQDVRLQAPFSVFAGKEIIIKSMDANRVKVTRYVPGEDERRLECSTRLDDIVRTIVAIGGGYADVYQAVREAEKANALLARVQVNALPTPDRKYDGSEESSDQVLGVGSAATPEPELFYERDNEREDAQPDMEDRRFTPPPGFWGKMKQWLTPWSSDEEDDE